MEPNKQSKDSYPEFVMEPPVSPSDGLGKMELPPVNLEGVMQRLNDLDAARQLEPELLQRMKERLPELEKLAREIEGHWGIEDGFYRFYHQSWKVYGVQTMTKQVVKLLQELLPERPLNDWFMVIVRQGTEKNFEMSHNAAWLENTRPILEAFFHAHYFLKMVCKYARDLDPPPEPMPSGWAAVLYLFGMR